MAELLISVRFRVSALRVAQSTLLPFGLGIERQTVWSSLYFRWGCYGSTPQAVIVRNDVKLHIILFLPQPGYYDRAFVLYG